MCGFQAHRRRRQVRSANHHPPGGPHPPGEGLLGHGHFAVHGQRPLQRTLLQHHAQRFLLHRAAMRQKRSQSFQGRRGHPIQQDLQHLQDPANPLRHAREVAAEADRLEVLEH